MPRRQGSALLIALLVGTAALAALVAFTGSLLFTEPRAKAVAAAGPQGVARTPAAPARSTGQWLATWAAAPVLGATDPEQGPDPSLRTIRNVVHTSIGGDAARITLSNLFGTQPLLVDHVTVNALPVTFRNAPSVTIAAGGQIISDPVVAPVAADADLVVTLRTPTARGPVTVHPNSHQTSSTEGPQGTRPTTDWRYLTAVDVRGMAATGTLVAFGDSLTAGSGSTTDANSRWPDVLADRLVEPVRSREPGHRRQPHPAQRRRAARPRPLRPRRPGRHRREDRRHRPRHQRHPGLPPGKRPRTDHGRPAHPDRARARPRTTGHRRDPDAVRGPGKLDPCPERRT